MSFKYQKVNQIDSSTYYDPFLAEHKNGTLKIEVALERAWKNRDFEIDKYWSRATYFWAFIAAAFTGYFAISGGKIESNPSFPELPFVIASLGLVFSAAWYFVNNGSKKWQENWEKHIDLLEDSVTGPLYKTVLMQKGYSVSKINLLVSEFVFLVWVALWLRSMFPWSYGFDQWEFSFLKTFVAIATSYFIYRMTGKHDGNVKKKIPDFNFSRREIV